MTKKVLKRWTEEELNKLEELCNESKDVLISTFPDRSWKSIHHKIVNMKLPRIPDYYRYTKEEDNILKENHLLPQEELLGLLPERNWESIRQRCKYLKLKRPQGWNLWTKEEEEILNKCKTLEEAKMKLVNRNDVMIASKASKMNIDLSIRTWRDWEDEYLKNNYPKGNMNDILNNLTNRSLQSVYTRANALGIERGWERFDIEDEDILSLYSQGMYMSQIARELSISDGMVKVRLVKNGIKPVPKILYGSEAPSWKGGITNPNIRERGRREYRAWRSEVFEKDNYTCQKCWDNKGHNLQAHHILNFSTHRDLRYSLKNGITLCETCHMYGRNSFHGIYSTRNNTQEQLEEFLGRKIDVNLYYASSLNYKN